eukprot:gene9145-1443_t
MTQPKHRNTSNQQNGVVGDANQTRVPQVAAVATAQLNYAWWTTPQHAWWYLFLLEDSKYPVHLKFEATSLD